MAQNNQPATGIFGGSSGVAGTNSFGALGSSATGGIFGQANTGAATGSLFGNAAANTSATQNTAASSGGSSLFGAGQSSAGGIFGGASGGSGPTPSGQNAPVSTFAFGSSSNQNSAASGSGGLSGSSGGLFGQKPPQSSGQTTGGSGGIFGSTSTQGAGASTFGSNISAPSGNTSSAFGQGSAGATSSIFGGAATTQNQAKPGESGAGGLFGASAQNKPATESAGGFGASSSTEGSTGLFGATSTKNQNSENKPAQGTGLLSSGTSQTGPQGFGSSTQQSATTSLFGGASQKPPTQANSQTTASSTTGDLNLSSFGQTNKPPGGSALFGGQTTSAEQKTDKTAPAAGGLFGSGASSSGLFGSGTSQKPEDKKQGSDDNSLPKLNLSGMGMTSHVKESENKSQLSAPSAGGSLFGAATQQTGASLGGTAFGGDSKPQPSTSGTGNLFGNLGNQDKKPEAKEDSKPQSTGGLNFGGAATGGGSSIFGGASAASQQKTDDKPAATGAGSFGSSGDQAKSNIFGGQASGASGVSLGGLGGGVSKFGADDSKKQPDASSTGANMFGQKPPAQDQQQPGGINIGSQQNAGTSDQSQQQQQILQGQPQIQQAQPMQAQIIPDEQQVGAMINKWRHQVEQNEHAFQDTCSQLLTYESLIYESLGQIKRVEASSKEVINIYMNNHKTIKGIADDQTQIIDELSQIERELDTLIASGGNQQLIQYFNQAVSDQDKVDLSKVTSREQIYGKALQIEKEIEEMNRELVDVQTMIDQKQRKGEEKFNIVVNGQSLNLDSIVNSYYETLLWLENAAVDLNYQVEEVAGRLGMEKS
eukprot:403354179